MSHEDSEVGASFRGSLEGARAREGCYGGGVFPRSVHDGLLRLEERLRAQGRSRWARRPQAADRALRELDDVALAARAVNAGEPGAREVFRRIVGEPAGAGAAPVRGERAAVVAGGPIAGGALTVLLEMPCGDRVAGAVSVLQAGFAIDLAERNTVGRWTTQARAFVDARMGVVDRYTASMRADLGRQPGAEGVDPRGAQPGGGLGIPAEPDIPGRPGGGIPGLPPPDGGDLPPIDPCASVTDLCLGLYQEMVAEGLNDHLIELIQTVRPNCLCSGFDQATVFTAEPARGGAVPQPVAS